MDKPMFKRVNAPRPPMDFGLLKVRKMTIKPAEAIIYKEDSKGRNSVDWTRQTHDKMIETTKGTDLKQIRSLSKYFFQTNGVYARAVRYLADIYKYDFLLYPNLDLDLEMTDEFSDKILKKFNVLLEHFDNSAIQLMCRKWANAVCIEGCYYGYICDDVNDKLTPRPFP